MCGLKLEIAMLKAKAREVTPFVGVWIETVCRASGREFRTVTPFVGVWIETHIVPTFRGLVEVTPFVGVWIETADTSAPCNNAASHTLRGCVD